MEMRSGRGRTSSWLAKEKRSRVAGREDKDYSSVETGVDAVKARVSLRERRSGRQRAATATAHHRPYGVAEQAPFRRVAGM